MAWDMLADINIDFSPIPKDKSFEGLEEGDDLSYGKKIDWLENIIEIIEIIRPEFEALTLYVNVLEEDEDNAAIQITTRQVMLDSGDEDYIEKVEKYLKKRFPEVEISVSDNYYSHTMEDEDALYLCSDFEEYKEQVQGGYIGVDDLDETEVKEWYKSQEPG
jgi:hypothetical protein